MARTPTRGPGRPPLPDDVRADRAAARSTATTNRSRAGRVLRTLYLDEAQAERLERLRVEGGHASASAVVEAATEAITNP